MQRTKGIVLAGGSGTRLYPLTKNISKQLLPIYDKPMIYYPLSVLMLSKIQDVLIISTPEDIPRFQQHFGDGSHLGLSISYEVQEKPNGIAEAFIVGEHFCRNADRISLILGDNIFYGHQFTDKLNAGLYGTGAMLYGYRVKDPKRFGIVEFDDQKQVLSIEEKPENPKSNFAVTGLYFYDRNVVEIAKSLSPSPRGELEITDVNKVYMENGNCSLEILGRGFSWLDTGTPESLYEAGEFVRNIEKRQGYKIACLEEISYYNGWITANQLEALSNIYNNSYGEYLKEILP